MKALRHRFEYIFTLLAAWCIQKLSLEQSQAFARALGRLTYACGVARDTSLQNLALVFPDKSAVERQAIAKAAYEQFATTLIELFRLPVTSGAEIEGMFEFENLDILDRLKAEGRGAVCISAHYGNWEWMGAALVSKGYPMTFMIGTQSNPHSDRLFNEYRQKVNMPFVRIAAFRDVLKGLKAGRFMAALGDQDGDKYGRFSRFFGQEVSTHIFWEATALRTGSAILFGVPERLGPRRHRMVVHQIPDAPAGMDEAQASVLRLQAYNDLLEAAIRKNPSMWLWMHSRFQSKAVHRLEGEERAMAEAGKARFDIEKQAWVSVPEGEALAFKTWKP